MSPMDMDSLVRILPFQMIDRFSVDTLTRSIVSTNGVKKAELYLKETGNPAPTAEVYGNIPCAVFQAERQVIRDALIVVHKKGISVLDSLPWLQNLILSGPVIVVIDGSGEDLPGRTVARIVKAVSYLDLRRDIVDRGRILLLGFEAYAMWVLCAAVLDERVSGAVLVNPPPLAHLPDSQILDLSEVVDLMRPRPIGLVGVTDSGRINKIVQAYENSGNRSAARYERESSQSVIEDMIRWMMRREELDGGQGGIGGVI